MVLVKRKGTRRVKCERLSKWYSYADVSEYYHSARP